jgi:toxin HigB-1
MIVSFRSKALADLWRQGNTSKIDGRMHARILRRLDALNAATKIESLNIPGFDFHSLRGFSPTRYTIHVNGPWCITFCFLEGEATEIDFEQYH